MHIKLSNTWGKNDTVHSSPRRIPLKKLLKKKKTVWVLRQKVNSLTENRKSHWEVTSSHCESLLWPEPTPIFMQSFSVLANNPHSKEKVTELSKVWLQAKCSSRTSSLFWKTEDIKSVPWGLHLWPSS